MNAALLIGAHVSVDPTKGPHKEPFIDRLLDDPVSVLTIGVVLFTALLVYVTYRLVDSTILLWEAGEKQLVFLRESSERQLRAYLLVTKCNIESIVVGGRPKIKITFKNFGQTPAYEQSVWINAGFDHFPHKIPFPFDEQGALPESIIGPGQEIILYPELAGSLGFDEYQMMSEGKAAIYCFGQIRYKDAFDQRRFTQFVLFCNKLSGMEIGAMASYNEGNIAT